MSLCMPLGALLPELPEPLSQREICGISLDARHLRPGELFIARAGVKHHATDFLGQAAQAGAVAALIDAQYLAEPLLDTAMPVWPLEDFEARLGWLVSAFYGHPSNKLKVIGITGTNGKTSTTHFLAQALNALHKPCALMGTIGNGFLDQLQASTHTTPDLVRVHALLAQYQAQGAQYVAMEVSSHALDQGRVAGVHFQAAGFTNLTRDHLDYHPDMTHYAASKAKLFQQPLDYAFLNLDDACAQEWMRTLPQSFLTYSLDKPEADIYLADVQLQPQGMSARLVTPWGEAALETPLLGHFNLSNLLLTAGLLGVQGFTLTEVVSALAQVQPVQGRLQVVSREDEPLVLVDYAHTPDALEKVLVALKAHRRAEGKLILVFGCGGDRDKGKRPLMAAVAEAWADELVITSDNPRYEAPEQIIEEVCAGLHGRLQPQIEVDRAQAITYALDQAEVKDIVLIAGKGHETYQEVGAQRFPFSDQEIAQQVLALRRQQA
ncbi:UDP-N-acetylmuramoyl-L-alanyl-D-glutamate--2,6-diaminopimelate ligase [Nitrincola tapanii]|uniref:UDP-N-acetylmuramoyl-L-alanyl-D-glutamate--2,6-diaminopimelate ligase n=1 Tax=Nitrincola tapanii TaxID=1708751 RepID=A0A5A9VZK2_9GAMM|nr:UDP-N-acetylmuramoyl-L-alanyl-D-glutamate--2,6-diaminopimelate ligase [Nitrincola tapanii]KAA0873927.1 UDP-N-acetylmuramoyl-L-alanyl-D-glutamate--2,6-diaminopimelate ligase [Nitrincola tapanii]